jgi:hypothetical protein
MKKTLITSLFIASALIACKSSKETSTTKTTAVETLDCSKKAVVYADIKSVIETSCSGCHNEKHAKAGFNALSIESIKTAANTGELLGSIKHSSGYLGMPKGAPQLEQATIDKIECWMKNGMKE